MSPTEQQNHLPPRPREGQKARANRPAQNSHGHLELLHPLPLHVFRLAEELKALLSLEVNQVEAIGPLWGQRHAGSWHGFVGDRSSWQLAVGMVLDATRCTQVHQHCMWICVLTPYVTYSCV